MTFTNLKAAHALSTAIFSTLLLTACASTDERRGPPSGSQGGPQGERPERGERGGQGGEFSGVAARPVGFLYVGMDANGDGMTSKAELSTGTAQLWKTLSPNGGSVSAIYFSDWSARYIGSTDAQPTFIAFDRDFSGAVTASEFSDYLSREFTAYDKNADGSLQRGEFLFGISSPAGQPSGQGGGRGEGGGGGQGGGMGGGQR